VEKAITFNSSDAAKKWLDTLTNYAFVKQTGVDKLPDVSKDMFKDMVLDSNKYKDTMYGNARKYHKKIVSDLPEAYEIGDDLNVIIFNDDGNYED
jgi:hypothetical protein